MDIYFLRHASAGEPVSDSQKDEKRPIDKDGQKQARDVGRALAALKVELDVAISSTLTRAVQTAQIVLSEMKYKEKLVLDDAMRPESGFEQFRRMLSNYDDKKSVMVIGHNPSITEFLTQTLLPKASADFINFKKGAVAKIETDGRQATLRWFLTPKLARALAGSKQDKSQKRKAASKPKAVRKPSSAKTSKSRRSKSKP